MWGADRRGPFYAVRVVAGSLGTFAGLAVNEHAQALDHKNMPIEGLYAAGNDMASVMGGHYPSGGITAPGPRWCSATSWRITRRAGRCPPMPCATTQPIAARAAA